MNRRSYPGRCHCGAVRFEYRAGGNPSDWPVRACQCRFCRSHDAATTSSRDARIEFYASDNEALNRYRFGLKTADFLLCRNCGVYVGAFVETDNGGVGIINTRALHPRPSGLKEPSPVSYDGETADDRLARRAERWSPACGFSR